VGPPETLRHTGRDADVTASELPTTPVDQAVGEAALAATPAGVKRRNGSPTSPSTTTRWPPETVSSSFKSPPSTRARTPAARGRRPATRASKSVAMRPPVCANAVPGATKARATARSADRRATRASGAIRDGPRSPTMLAHFYHGAARPGSLRG
jgi:hypothetical protein